MTRQPDPPSKNTTPAALDALLIKLQEALDLLSNMARDIRPEGRHGEEVDVPALIRQLACFAEPLAEGRVVRTRNGGRRRVRGWVLPEAVYALKGPVSEFMAKQQQTGMSLLHAAIREGDPRAVDWLLRAGFSPTEYAAGRPPMGFAYFDDRPRAVRLLWNHGATHDHPFRDSPRLPKALRGSTQFHRLLERGARGLNTADPAERTRLHDRCEVARFYAATYPNPMVRNSSGLSAFDLAPTGDPVAEAAKMVVAAKEAAMMSETLPGASTTSPTRPRI